MKVSIRNDSKSPVDVKRVRNIAGRILKDLGLTDCELSIVLTDNPGIRELNRKYLRIDRPTDVLSFPMEEPVLLGDVVISVEKAKGQAKKYGASFFEETSRLLTHGILHLIGYDHAKGRKEAKRMREKEEEVLRGLRKGRTV